MMRLSCHVSSQRSGMVHTRSSAYDFTTPDSGALCEQQDGEESSQEPLLYPLRNQRV